VITQRAAEAKIAERWRLIGPLLDERQRRLWAGAEAEAYGPGGIGMVARATGLSADTVGRGRAELRSGETPGPGRVRQPGGGRRPLTETDPTLLADLEGLVDPVTRGDPESPLRWTSKSLVKLAQGLRAKGHQVSASAVGALLKDKLNYRLQGNKKTREGADHPDRDAQFQFINDTATAALAAGQPVISVDTKKKELVGNYKQVGREYEPSGQPVEVNTHDFPDKTLGKAVPYGVYDLGRDEGFVSVGISFDTAQFSVAAIQAWWEQLGRERYPAAQTLTITADCGGSNGYRTRLFKTELQRLADATGLELQVRHYPPGTSKWNKIEHRLFSYIGQNWRGKPLISHQVIIELIAATTTGTGLKVYARLDENDYPKGLKVTKAQLAAVNLARHDWHPDWNYSIKPSRTRAP
jgi:DDE family transposase